MIPHFVLEWEKGYDIVYGKREKRPEPYPIHLMRKLFYRLNRSVADSEVILDMAEFSLIGSHVRDVIVANRSTFPFLRSEVGYAGFERKGLLYERERRAYAAGCCVPRSLVEEPIHSAGLYRQHGSSVCRRQNRFDSHSLLRLRIQLFPKRAISRALWKVVVQSTPKIPRLPCL
jgi:hypothetical protein